MKLSRFSKHPKLEPSKNDGAWFYENAGSIDVYIYPKGGGTAATCRIQRALLADWIKRTEKAKR